MSVSPASQCAREILRELQIDRPELLSYLPEICMERGAFVREAQLDSSDARLTVRGDQGIITVKPNSSYQARTRFSIAHELGHFELHRRLTPSQVCDMRALNDWYQRSEAQCRETEANEFAAEFLMPAQFMRPDIYGERPSLQLLDRLATKYQTSLLATARRFIDLTTDACAVILFKPDIVQTVWRSELFEQQRFWIDSKLDPRSFAWAAASGKEMPDQPREVGASCWLNVPSYFADEPVLEQSRFFNGISLGVCLLQLKSAQLIRFS